MPINSRLRQFIESALFWKGISLLLFLFIIFSQVVKLELRNQLPFLSAKKQQSIALNPGSTNSFVVDANSLSDEVLPAAGVSLPVQWGDLGQRLVADGVIDEAKFRALFENGLDETEEELLTGNSAGQIVMNQENSHFLLDMLWAFGLANKNDILENGEMTDEQYGGAGNFAATGGWTLAQGAGMDHYSAHAYVPLTAEQQAKVDRVSRGIFRPCCGNSTHFPDCNHGMAMLGLLELMAANSVSEADMYRVALQVNAYWFPQTYLDLATYFAEQGQSWHEVDPQLVLGSEYSSARGYQQTRQKIQSLPKPQQGGGGCGA